MPPLLQVKGLRAGFGAREVVAGVDLQVEAGELWVVLGPNGAGKSTLLRSVLGLHPISGGEVRLFGTPLGQWDRAQLARRVAWVPQLFDAAFGFTGLEVVAMGRSPHHGLLGLPSKSDIELALAELEALGISKLADRPATALSGGEQRLLLLARAWVQAPELLLLDEPTAFLDLRHQVETLAHLRARTRDGLGAVAVLHDVNLAAGFADKVLLLRDGKALAAGPTREVLTSAALEALYQVPMTAVIGEGGQPVFAPRLVP